MAPLSAGGTSFGTSFGRLFRQAVCFGIARASYVRRGDALEEKRGRSEERPLRFRRRNCRGYGATLLQRSVPKPKLLA